MRGNGRPWLLSVLVGAVAWGTGLHAGQCKNVEPGEAEDGPAALSTDLHRRDSDGPLAQQTALAETASTSCLGRKGIYLLSLRTDGLLCSRQSLPA